MNKNHIQAEKEKERREEEVQIAREEILRRAYAAGRLPETYTREEALASLRRTARVQVNWGSPKSEMVNTQNFECAGDDAYVRLGGGPGLRPETEIIGKSGKVILFGNFL